MLRTTAHDGDAPPKVRRRPALLLNQLDAFDEVIALFPAAGTDGLGQQDQLLLAEAFLGRALFPSQLPRHLPPRRRRDPDLRCVRHW